MGKSIKKNSSFSYLIGSIFTNTLFAQGKASEATFTKSSDPTNQDYVSAGINATICNFDFLTN